MTRNEGKKRQEKGNIGVAMVIIPL